MIGKLLGRLLRGSPRPPAHNDQQALQELAAVLATEIRSASSQIKSHLANQGLIAAHQLVHTLLSHPDYQAAERLERHGLKVYSQNDEDGILGEIFRRIGAPHRSFVEFGCGDGMENNTVYLLAQGWRGLWMDGGDENAKKVHAGFSYLIEHGLLQFRQAMVTAENIDALITAAGLGGEIDLLSIDIDGNDDHLWRAIKSVSARVVVIEYNGKFPPPHRYSISYDPAHAWDGSDRVGNSLATLAASADAMGYQLVGCNLLGVNAFFVRADLAGDLFPKPATAEHLYQPPRYFLQYYQIAGHPANSWTIVESAVRYAGLPWPPSVPLGKLIAQPALFRT
ncbi:MAG TPA: hypothetical protein VH105_12200 [Burkholderiales bacterium]|jgi:hypothetical protein|nr:hypothetical protein [Burkholderiales bacterium]